MLRATRGGISRLHFQRNTRHPSSEPLLTPFLYPLILRKTEWLRSSSNSAPLRAPDASMGLRTGDQSYASVQIPDSVASMDGSFAGGLFGVGPRRSPLEEPQLVIVDTPRPRDDRRRTGMKSGISDDKHSVLSTFEACIKVGRIARAQLMLKAITTQLDHSSPLLIGAHNTFLKALLNRALADNDQDSLRVFFAWYEDTMKRDLRLKPDATTIALLLKGSLAVDNIMQGQRYIKKYVGAWTDQGVSIKDVFGLSILEDDQIISIARGCGFKPSDLSEEHAELLKNAEPAPENDIAKIPQVKASDVKGSSLAAVKKSLASLLNPDVVPNRHAFGADDISFQIERQKLLERDAVESAQEQWRKDHEKLAAKGVAPLGNSINSLLWSWHQSLVPIIKQELDRVALSEEQPDIPNAADRCLYGPFLRLMPPEKIAAIVVLQIVKQQNAQLNGEGTKSSHAVMSVGRILEQEYYAQELAKRKNSDIFGGLKKEALAALFEDPIAFRKKVTEAREKLAAVPQSTAELMLEWPAAVKAKLGAVLISMLLHCAKVPVTKRRPDGEKVTQHQSAMNHGYEYIKGRRLGVIRLHPNVIKRLSAEPLQGSTLGRNLPMLVPPRPWVSWNDGGYYYTRSRVVRTKSSREQDIYVQTASARGDLDGLFQGLDVLGRTAWRINKKVFDVVLQVWNDGGRFADIPPRELDMEIPPEPLQSADPKVRFQWLKKVREIKHEEKNNHSQRCDINLKMEIARAFLFEKFYFPHNVDFRGRAYPIPPNLNHIGNDLSRGIMMFAEGKELGETGLQWLKIHCANLAGYDKASFSDRVKFVDEHMDDIFDSADKPLEGRRWWLQAEDPWQTLATCFSIAEAVRSPDPTKYKCHTVVAQDGTCNGLQHYAALGGDKEGAKQVNLEPSDKPQDVYTGVAELVKKQVAIDAQKGHVLAKMLEGHITRKVVKQSVMTNVYGVTFIGARNQILNQLDDNPNLPKEHRFQMASYLTRLVFNSISTVFTGATKIQNWFARSARMISRSISPAQFEDLEEPNKRKGTGSKNGAPKDRVEFMTSVVWTTPLGMAIVQPYRHEANVVVKTNLQKIYISDPASIDEVNSKKQMTAFPPNFIHSLDATHMLLSAVKCAEHGLAFAAVHDSFWTHPSDVDTLNRILRDAFINLHSENLIEKLRDEFVTRYKGYKYLVRVPESGALDKNIKEIRRNYAQMKYGRGSLTAAEDLQWEIYRDKLLASEDPEERKKGQQMITPSVLVERAGGALNLEQPESLGAELGSIDAISPEEDMGVADVFEDSDARSDPEVSEEPSDELSDELSEESEELSEELSGEPETKELDEPEMQTEAGKKKKGKGKKAAKPQPRGVHVWVPLEFPPLPKKGDFEVAKLKNSQYFFS